MKYSAVYYPRLYLELIANAVLPRPQLVVCVERVSARGECEGSRLPREGNVRGHDSHGRGKLWLDMPIICRNEQRGDTLQHLSQL